jgi:all-trans-retinol 13,14-reductase
MLPLFKSSNVKDFDAIVIGSGLGGLTCASLLARFGKKVLILEKHSVPGGFTHSFSRKGFEWDVGVHYVGQVHKPNSILRKIFDYVSDGQLKWAPMDMLYDRAIIAGDVYDFEAGVENQIAMLLKSFPDEEKAVRAYYQLVQSVGASSAWFFGERTMPSWLSNTVGFFLRRKFSKLSQETTYAVIKRLTQNEKLISVLCAQCGDYGMTPKQSSVGIHAIVVEHYLDGGAYPVGGAKRIHETILAVFKKHSGEIRLRSEVTKILTENKKSVGVVLKTGEQIFAPAIISNAGARNTFKNLLAENPKVQPGILSDLEKLKASTAHLCLYLGLEGSDEALNLPKHNLWIYNEYDFDQAYEKNLNDPAGPASLTYISFPSAKDPDWAKTHPGKSTIQVITSCTYESVKKWQQFPWMKRGDEYVKFKEEMRDRLLEKAYVALPQIRGKVIHAEVSTPLSTKHFMNYEQGEIYGLEHSPKRFSLRWLRPATSFKGLYLTGQDIVTVGVGGAIASGVLTAIVILKREVLKAIFKRKLPA